MTLPKSKATTSNRTYQTSAPKSNTGKLKSIYYFIFCTACNFIMRNLQKIFFRFFVSAPECRDIVLEV